MKYIHLKCLQEWLNGKKSTRELPLSTIYLFRNTQCELCKAQYPEYVREQNKKIEIFTIQRPQSGNYLVLEVLGMTTGKTLQIIYLIEDVSLKVGRGQDSDVRVADISVSRSHSLIKYDSATKQVILSDYNSKFGTLKLLREPI
jgi:pSer/pThr/pTyr-binding forkhead associated (FHA) protein